MQTDSLFYALFQSVPSLLFELLERDPTEAEGYQFASVELKQTAFRIDGVFRPPEDTPDAPIYFVEVQFQRDPQLYRRLFSEVLLYLRQNPAVEDWRAVVLYPDLTVEVAEGALQEFLETSRVEVIYLNELGAMAELTPGLGILRLLIEPVETVPEAARGLIERVQQGSRSAVDTARLIELIETIVVYTFPRRSREEIAAMLGLSELRETRVYQEGREEGREEEARSLISRQLTRKLGPLPDSLQAQVKALSLEQLEALGEALFDFAEASDLEGWLAQP
ncbi:Rpn family recombination-promoting nuclease/putative transposase [Oscillatoria sp. CS-180]|uniref:Rpn family recombination-promoting nuclease/putative transposase n=1 Tax=Oscillatoria sp. CS-180 TaxID=3021720 RepID=UPI00232EAA3B|nr:Rpn family recombination-promoting nuclease/putative transposase [Oscillatoria sp. CS-180]MDB9526992.1 Rpn family recombination-promoting nuclease/putative transposase [Oscillatoria sp. CS-180]